MARRDDDDRDEREYEDEYDDRRERGGYLIPHRGGLILAFGIISTVMAPTALVLFCLANLVGLPLGILAWVWGRKDLRAIEAGEMDPEGRGLTQGGYVMGIIGTVLNALSLLVIGGFFLIYAVIVGIALGTR